MAKLDDMMGAMSEMPEAGAEPAEKVSPKLPGDLSEEEMGFAEDMGFDATKAQALKRFIKSCMASEEAGEYDMPEEPAEDTGEM